MIPWGSILLVVIVCGLIAYLVDLSPLREPFKKIAIVVIILAALLYIAQTTGIIDWLNSLGSSPRRAH